LKALRPKIFIWNSKSDKEEIQKIFKVDEEGDLIKEIYIECNTENGDNKFVELLEIPVKFTYIKPKEDENIKKEKYRYILITQSLLFKEDDRGEQPFLLV